MKETKYTNCPICYSFSHFLVVVCVKEKKKPKKENNERKKKTQNNLDVQKSTSARQIT